MTEHQYPSFAQQGKNLAKFSFDVMINAMRSGAFMVSDAEQASRTEICRNCEYYDEAQHRCKHCGCMLAGKIPFAIDSCPITKWSTSSENFENKFDDIMKKTEREHYNHANNLPKEE